MAAEQIIDEITAADDLAALDALRVRLLGKSGEITAKLLLIEEGLRLIANSKVHCVESLESLAEAIDASLDRSAETRVYRRGWWPRRLFTATLG